MTRTAARATLLTATLATAVASLTTLASGCGCAVSGQYDTVYKRGQDQLILCENGGFVATVGATTTEGWQRADASHTRASAGTTGDLAFELDVLPDGTATSTGLGDGAWQRVALDSWSLTHANQACLGLEDRAWWLTPSTLPVATAFASAAGQLLLCPDGTVHGTFGDGAYTTDLATVTGSTATGATFTATLAADGTLTQVSPASGTASLAGLAPVAAATLAPAYRCAL